MLRDLLAEFAARGAEGRVRSYRRAKKIEEASQPNVSPVCTRSNAHFYEP